MGKRLWMALLCLGLVAVTAAFAACGDDDDGGSEADEQEVTDLVQTLANSNGAEATQEEIDFYMAHITDSFVQDFGTEDVAACEADAETCIGEPLPNATVSSVEIDGDEATAVIGTDIGLFGLKLTKIDDTWKASSTYVPDDEIVEGTEVVDLVMKEFAFEGDLESDAVKSGNFAFHATNEGEQNHEVVLVALPEDGTLEELLNDDSFEPEPIFVKVPYHAGEGSDIAVSLEAGRYGLVCFLPDTDDDEGTPHAFKGMLAEFFVE